jgi:predicted enzyme related to lactoylglutathione lyase
MIVWRISLLLLLALVIQPHFVVRAQSKDGVDISKVRVRYMVNELDPAVSFYTTHLGFQVERESKPNFAMLDRGNLELVLSTSFGPGGAAKPMFDGRKAEPGGWNRIILNVNDLQAEVARLKQAHLHFRNDIVSGPGGSETLLDDPSGNPIELFQPAR